jgi:hypothetical protein
MFRSPEGATVAQIANAMSWEPHDKSGRTRRGAKDSYTSYRIAAAG